MSDIFKKISYIEPLDEEVLQDLKITLVEEKPHRSLLRPLNEDSPEDDPVPAFITRQHDTQEKAQYLKKSVTTSEPAKANPVAAETKTLEDIKAAPVMTSAIAVPEAMTSIYDYTPSTSWMKWVGIVTVLIWLGASFAYVYGFFDLGRKWTDLTPIQIAGLTLAVLFPAVLLGLLFYALRQLSKISSQAHNITRAAHALTQPDDSVVAKAAIMSKAVKTEIDSVDARIDQALARMSTLERVIKDQTEGLNYATTSTAQTADEIASRLSTQRIALETIAGTFDNRMAMLTTTLDEQSSKLEASTQLAEHKIQEARVSIDGAAEKINAASDVVKGNTVEAASTLTKSHEEIENLAEMIRTRSAELDEVYRKHAKDLTLMIGQLRDEQQDMSISLEERLVKMRDMSLSAKVSAESLTEASKAGKQTVQALAEATRLTDTAVKQRFSEMEDMVKFSSEKADTISDRAARRVQDSLAQTRKEIARIENDMAALQTRLNTPQPAGNLPLGEPEQPKPKKRSRIRLKPLEEDFPPVEPPRIADDPSKTSSAILRPAPETRAIFAPAPAAPQAIPKPDDHALELLDELTLEVEPLDLTADIAPIDLNESMQAFTPETNTLQSEDTLRPAVPPADEEIIGFGKRKNKAKSGWRWRDMLGGLDRPDDVQPTAQPLREISNQRMMASLANLGLTPAAIVDDGCIIEAANTRKTKGAFAMSQTVALRLGDPIRHLNRAMEENPALKTDARAYVAQFKARISAIENDREAIRTKLESDAGRAFLLCDAALNG